MESPCGGSWWGGDHIYICIYIYISERVTVTVCMLHKNAVCETNIGCARKANKLEHIMTKVSKVSAFLSRNPFKNKEKPFIEDTVEKRRRVKEESLVNGRHIQRGRPQKRRSP